MGVVNINVVGDQAARRFTCNAGLLAASMGHLRPLLQHVGAGMQANVDVRCDATVFEWCLLHAKSVHGGGRYAAPQLSLDLSLPVLAAAGHLQMPDVVALAGTFVADHLVPLTAAAQQMMDLDPPLLARVAQAASEQQLEQLADAVAAAHPSAASSGAASGQLPACASPAARKLVGKLFKLKLEGTLRELGSSLARCSACGQLFSAAAHATLECPAAAAAATAAAEAAIADGGCGGDDPPQDGAPTLHVPDPGWRLADHLARQRRGERRAWRDIFWAVAADAHVLHCAACQRHFPAAAAGQCGHHTGDVAYGDSGQEMGTYPCCGRPAWQPGMPAAWSAGCTGGKHTLGMAPGVGTPLWRQRQIVAGLVAHGLQRPYQPPPGPAPAALLAWQHAGAGSEEGGSGEDEGWAPGEGYLCPGSNDGRTRSRAGRLSVASERSTATTRAGKPAPLLVATMLRAAEAHRAAAAAAAAGLTACSSAASLAGQPPAGAGGGGGGSGDSGGGPGSGGGVHAALPPSMSDLLASVRTASRSTPRLTIMRQRSAGGAGSSAPLGPSRAQLLELMRQDDAERMHALMHTLAGMRRQAAHPARA